MVFTACGKLYDINNDLVKWAKLGREKDELVQDVHTQQALTTSLLNVRKAQRRQKYCHDQKAKEPRIVEEEG